MIVVCLLYSKYTCTFELSSFIQTQKLLVQISSKLTKLEAKQHKLKLISNCIKHTGNPPRIRRFKN